jgi:FtsP/CotA-like multicopper oxidase with cupredoxin domain
MNLKASQSTKTRSMRVQRDDLTNMWTIADTSWQEVIASGFKSVMANPALGATEIWEIENKSGGWFHPVHIHLVDFQILTRNGKAPFPHEMGPKDVVYVGEGEKVRVLMKFTPHEGMYMMHCHNLPHEDHDMMAQFRVGLGPDDIDVNHPIHADPAKWDNED